MRAERAAGRAASSLVAAPRRWSPASLRAPLLCALLGSSALLSAAAVQAAPAPDFALRDTQGRVFRLSEQRGRTVALVFWSSRCGRCDTHLRTLLEGVGDLPVDEFTTWVVSIDRQPARSRALAASLPVPVLDDSDREVAAAFDLPPLPAVYLVDVHGELRDDRRSARAPDPLLVQARSRALMERAR